MRNLGIFGPRSSLGLKIKITETVIIWYNLYRISFTQKSLSR